MNIFTRIFRLISGFACFVASFFIWSFAISVTLSWWAFCFGTVIIGILLLIIAPHILLAPLVIGIPGTGMFSVGLQLIFSDDFLYSDVAKINEIKEIPKELSNKQELGFDDKQDYEEKLIEDRSYRADHYIDKYSE